MLPVPESTNALSGTPPPSDTDTTSMSTPVPPRPGIDERLSVVEPDAPPVTRSLSAAPAARFTSSETVPLPPCSDPDTVSASSAAASARLTLELRSKVTDAMARVLAAPDPSNVTLAAAAPVAEAPTTRLSQPVSLLA